MEELTLDRARAMGEAAFARGAKCVPAHDRDFIEALYMVSHRMGGSLPYYDEWYKGWNTANLRAPVES